MKALQKVNLKRALKEADKALKDHKAKLFDYVNLKEKSTGKTAMHFLVTTLNSVKKNQVHPNLLKEAVEFLRRLLDMGADPNATDNDNQTPLIIAEAQEYRAVLEMKKVRTIRTI